MRCVLSHLFGGDAFIVELLDGSKAIELKRALLASQCVPVCRQVRAVRHAARRFWGALMLLVDAGAVDGRTGAGVGTGMRVSRELLHRPLTCSV